MKIFCSKDCPDLCGAEAEVKDGKFLFKGLREDWQTTGFVCSKYKIFAEREINNGVKSFSVENGQRRYFDSDSDALDAVASLLNQYKDKKILYVKGSGSLAYNMAYWDAFMGGFENCYKVTGGVCDNTGDDAQEADFGCGLNPPAENIKTSDTIILFGKNAASISQHLYALLKELKKQGKKIIYIDPIKTKTADIADRYIRINPACDGLLAMALMVSLGLESGYEADELIKKCGISDDDFSYIKDSIITGKTAFIEGFGMQRHANGMNIVRLINRLAVKTGNQDRLYYGHGSKRFWTSPESGFKNFVNIDEAAKRLADGEFDLYVNVAANPAMTYPDAKTWAKGIKNTKTIVVDVCEELSSKDCDLFLKVGGMFSQKDFMASYFFEHKNERGSLTSEMSDSDAVKELAKRLGMTLNIPEKSEKTLPVRQYKDEYITPIMPETSDKYFMFSASHHSYLNSQILPSMIDKLQVVIISRKTADKIGAKNGDLIKVATDTGYYKAKAEISDMVDNKTVLSWKNIPMVEGLINDAVPSRLTDSGSGMVYYTVFADVTRC